ncbi:hypothetical protein LCGC14_0554890 [marine sediment metagenome]|uniref:Uncharacterized protein n=1 Tax=marine sediment metagenome TaxID=412755 RepID=A0A0F9RTR6_9ZZZZ
MTTRTKIPNSIVRAAMDEPAGVDRDAKVARLQRELAKTRENIVEATRVQNRSQLVQSAYARLRRNLFAGMTREEREAVDGMYLFMHAGNVDLVRNTPSGTDVGENRRLERDLTMAEAMRETETVSETAG